MAAPTFSLPADGTLTRADFDNLPDAPEGWAWELHDGTLELIAMPVTYWHAEIILMLLAHWRAHGCRVAAAQRIADSGYAVGGKTRNNRVADGVVFIDGHIPDLDRATHAPDVIDIVIEAVSSRSEESDSVDKLALYAALGVPHYWIVRKSSDEDVDGVLSMYTLVSEADQPRTYELTGTSLVSQLVS